MAGTALKALQQAVRNKLTGDATLMAMITGVFDAVPKNQDLPYITVGDATEIPFNVFAKDGKEATITLHIWSLYKGFKEALDIRNRIDQLLDGQTLTITGFVNVLCQFENSETLRDPDGVTRHIATRYRVVVQEA